MLEKNSIDSKNALICWSPATHITSSGIKGGGIIQIFACENFVNDMPESSKGYLNKYGVNIPGWKSLEERTRFHKILHELRGIIILDGITENQFFEDMTVISGFTDWHLKHQGV